MNGPDTETESVIDDLNLEEDIGIAFEYSGADDNFSTVNDKECYGTHSSSTLRHNDISNISLADSGFDSLNSSYTSDMLNASSSSVNSHVLKTQSSTQDVTQCTPATLPQKTCPDRPKSPKTYEAKYPVTNRKKERKRPSQGCPVSGCLNGTQVSRLSTVMETEFHISPTLQHKFDALNKEHSETIRQLNESLHAQAPLTGSDSSDEQNTTPLIPRRTQSDAAMIKRMRERGHRKGSHSEGDIILIGSPVTVNIHMPMQTGTNDIGDYTRPHLSASNTDLPYPNQMTLPDEVMSLEVNSEVLLKLSQEITSWKFPARALGLKEAEIDQIFRDNHETKEQCFQMLRRWKDKYGQIATYQVLSKAILAMAKDVYPIFVQIVLSHVS